MKKEQKENLVRKYMDEQELTISEFARRANLAKSCVHYVLAGQIKTRRHTALKIAKATHGKVPISYFGYD